MEVHRGEVFYADLSPVVGSEQGGVRPVEQLRTLDKRRLRERAGCITPEDQTRVDQALGVSIGLSTS